MMGSELLTNRQKTYIVEKIVQQLIKLKVKQVQTAGKKDYQQKQGFLLIPKSEIEEKKEKGRNLKGFGMAKKNRKKGWKSKFSKFLSKNPKYRIPSSAGNRYK